MATVPVAHSSSPPVYKGNVNNAGATSASFTPPANSCVVVGFTSDVSGPAADGDPIITNTGTALTWNNGASRRGGAPVGADAGIVNLWWATCLTSPGAITVNVDTNRSQVEIVPKMMVIRVYTSDQVDILDPIGATTQGSFGASVTSLSSGTITPETSNGGLRMMWLDWNATGIPTTFQANTELVDAYHNAGLSTNVQLGKSTYTVAGVGETIGANLVGASSDGNWIAYELRGPTTPPVITSGLWATETDGLWLTETGVPLQYEG